MTYEELVGLFGKPAETYEKGGIPNYRYYIDDAEMICHMADADGDLETKHSGIYKLAGITISKKLMTRFMRKKGLFRSPFL